MTQNPFKFSEQARLGGDLGGRYKREWVESSFDIESSDNPRLNMSHTKNYLGASISPSTVKIFLVCVMVSILAIVSKVFYLQVLQGSEYYGLAEGNRIRLRPIFAERGIIYDSKLRELVQNIPSFSLAIVPQDLPRTQEERERIVERLSEISGISQEEIKSTLVKYGNYSYESLVIKENLNYDDALRLYIENANLPGVLIESGTKRSYLTNASSTVSSTLSLSHILGYMGKLNDEELSKLRSKGYLHADTIGKNGVEKTYEAFLRGKNGQKKIEVNALGKEQSVLAEEAPTPGNNIVLTIDRDAQNKMENLVRGMSEKIGKRTISAIAINPKTGAILALVSWPAYDNNLFSGGISSENYKRYIEDKDRPLFNRAIGGMYPPGSTAKLVVAAAALEEGVVNRSTAFNSVGGFQVGNWFFKDWKAGGHGITNITKAIAWSVNTFFYYVGGGRDNFEGLGVDRIASYMRSFGLGKKTGIDLPGESEGFIPSREWKKRETGESWFIGDTYNLSIGQGGLQVSPLQVALWTSAIANDGTIVEPYVVETVVDPVTEEMQKPARHKIKNNLVSSANIQIIQDGMRQCVTDGSCGLLKSLPFKAAGKTGTAQWSRTYPTHAWFTSYAPLTDPEIVVTVLVEEGGEGAAAAMPIARDFLAWWGQHYLTHE